MAMTSTCTLVPRRSPSIEQLRAPVVRHPRMAVPPEGAGKALTRYSVIGTPPSEEGAPQVTTSRPPDWFSVTAVAAAGAAAGRAARRGVEAGPVPIALLATTSTYTVTPFASPPMTQVFVVAWQLPSMVPAVLADQALAWYPVMGAPPVEDGAAQLTATCWTPAVTATDRGTDGTVAGVPGTRGAEAGEVPKAFTATTSTYTARPLVSPVTVQAVEVAVQDPSCNPPLALLHALTR